MAHYSYRELPDADQRRRKAMAQELEALAAYCTRRASTAFNPGTTLTILRKKVIALQVRVQGAGCVREIASAEEWTPATPTTP